MAEPNYMAYAQYMGARNPLADGINQISGTLSDLQKQGMAREDQARRNSLADLQMRQAQMGIDAAQQDIDYKTGLRSAMQNPRSVTSITPKQPTSPNSLAGIMQNPMMGQQQPFAMPQQEVSPIVQAYKEGRVSTQTQTPTQAGAEYAMSQGRIDDVTKLISVDDALAQFGAKIAQGGGNPQEYYKAKAELDQGKEFFEFVKPYMKNPEQLKAMWPLLVKAYPKAAAINPESLKATKDGVAAPVTTPDGQIVPNKMYLYDNEGKMQLIDTTPKADPMEMMIKRDELASARQDKQIAAADRRAFAQIAAMDRRAQRTGGGQGYSSKPMPASAVKLQQDALDAVGVASKLQADVNGFIKLIDDKKLNFGPVNNLVAKGRNYIGMSDENSANLTNFKTSLEEIRNNILMLAKGVQTDGDALRAYNTLMDNINDPKVVRQQLVKITENNARNEKLQKAKANTIRSEYNKDEADFSGYTNQPAAIGKGATGNTPYVTKGGFKVTVKP